MITEVVADAGPITLIATDPVQTYATEELRPYADSPARLAADTLDVLALTPSDAGALGGNWRELPVEEIRELRRHKNLTAHLERLLGHLQPGPTRDQLRLWTETLQPLP